MLDLNAPTLPPVAGQDIALFGGVLEYVHGVARLSAFLCIFKESFALTLRE